MDKYPNDVNVYGPDELEKYAKDSYKLLNVIYKVMLIFSIEMGIVIGILVSNYL